MKKLIAAFLLSVAPVAALAAGGGAHLDAANVDLRDQASLQRGAKLFADYCMGCHGGGIGSTTDSTFAFARKLDGENFQRGWYHWSQKSVAGLNEPKMEICAAGVHYEYTYYLLYAKAGDEFRANDELRERFFEPDGRAKGAAFAALQLEMEESITHRLDKTRDVAVAQNWTEKPDSNFLVWLGVPRARSSASSHK